MTSLSQKEIFTDLICLVHQVNFFWLHWQLICGDYCLESGKIHGIVQYTPTSEDMYRYHFLVFFLEEDNKIPVLYKPCHDWT